MELLKQLLEIRKTSGSEIQALCPFHEDTKPSFFVNMDKQVYCCFGCGAKGHLIKLIQQLTDLPEDQVKKLIGNKNLPKKINKIQPEPRGRILTDLEIDVLTAYCNGLAGIMQGKLGDAREWRSYLYERGFSDETIQYFKLGANAISEYGKFFIDRMGKVNGKAEQVLRSLSLINEHGDYWYRPAVIIPYLVSGQVYFANARILPKYMDSMKYIGMKGVSRDIFFNDDALDEFEEIFCVEGEFNAIAMWQAGIKNVVSFGGKQQFSDAKINMLYGHRVIVYFDSDQNDPSFKTRNEVIQKLQKIAKSVCYFELPVGVDINDYLVRYGANQFRDEILGNIVDASDFLPSEYRIIPEDERDKVISLREAQKLNSEFFKHIADNFSYYSGKRVLVNMPVGTGKTSGAVSLVNKIKDKTLILTSTHYQAEDYDNLLDFDCFTVHLKGRGHIEVDCEYAGTSEYLASKGYALKFKLDYCYGKCQKADDCLHIKLLEASKHAGVLIATHAHGQLKDFFISPYYGNRRRNLIIIDEQCDLIKEVYFDRKTIKYNRELLENISLPLAQELSSILGLMEFARCGRQPFKPKLRTFSKQDIFDVDKAISKQINSYDGLLPNKLYDLVYALENGIAFEYDHDTDSLFYIWRAKLPKKACTIFMSATTTKAYLEHVLGMEIDHVLGQQYEIRRNNLQVIQLLNVTGGRWRLYGDIKLQDNIKEFFRAVLEKHKGQKILVITSQGSNITEADTKGSAKQRVISMLNPIAKAFGRKLIPVSTIDLEEGTVPDSLFDIPVIHYGIRGTNVFADYEVLIELNAHFYNEVTIAEGVRRVFGIDIQEHEPAKTIVKFRTVDKEYEVERYVHPIPEVRAYIEATQEGDIMQAEGRILRGEDTPKVIYRLHNINIKPYPSKIYKSWSAFMEGEFGVVQLRGKLKQILDWIQANKEINQNFSTGEVSNVVGGYCNNLNSRYLKKLQKLGYIKKIFGGAGKGNDTVWERLK